MVGPGDSFRFPCGVTVPNRICKAAMTEGLADARTNWPNARLNQLYRTWSHGGAGLLLTGNVLVDRQNMENPCNVALEEVDEKELGPYTEWAQACKSGGSLVVMQLSHAGRQTPRAVNPRPLAPSAVRLRIEGVPAFLASAPQAMTAAQVEDAIDRFVCAARVAERAGFDGIQVHGAHGYLCSQFLSPLVNQRTDQWGGDAPARRRFLLTIIKRIRATCKPSFIVGVKLNSADFQRGGFSEDESRDVIAELEALKVDFVEISGGTYERVAMFMMNANVNGNVSANGNPSRNLKQSTQAREAFFLEFALRVRREHPTLPLMLTGGLRSELGVRQALNGLDGSSGRGVDLVAIARPMCLFPNYPRLLLEGKSVPMYALPRVTTPLIPAHMRGVLTDSLQSLWHVRQLHLLADGQRTDPKLGLLYACSVMFVRNFLWEPQKLDVGARQRLGATILAALFLVVVLLARWWV